MKIEPLIPKDEHHVTWLRGQSLSICLTALALIFSSVALCPSPLAAAEPDPFVLHTASGSDLTGPLDRIGERWSVALAGADATQVPGKELVSLRRQRAALPPPPQGEFLVVAGGDLLPGRVVDLNGENLKFRADLGVATDLKLPLSEIAFLWVASPDGTEHADRLRRKLAAARRSRDALLLRNGDVMEGVVNALDRDKIEFEVDRKEVTVAFAKVAAVALNTDLARVKPPTETYAHVVLANGARLTLTSARSDGRTLTGTAAFGSKVIIPVAALATLDLRQGAAVYLSDLKPARHERRDFLGSLEWPYRLDASVENGDLRLGGATYDKGIGMHAEARLTYALGKAYRRFEAQVGLDDDDARPFAAAGIRVLVDGKAVELGTAATLTHRNRQGKVAVDVRGASELTLAVEFPQRLPHVPGDVNWMDARLIKAAPR